MTALRKYRREHKRSAEKVSFLLEYRLQGKEIADAAPRLGSVLRSSGGARNDEEQDDRAEEEEEEEEKEEDEKKGEEENKAEEGTIHVGRMRKKMNKTSVIETRTHSNDVDPRADSDACGRGLAWMEGGRSIRVRGEGKRRDDREHGADKASDSASGFEKLVPIGFVNSVFREKVRVCCLLLRYSFKYFLMQMLENTITSSHLFLCACVAHLRTVRLDKAASVRSRRRLLTFSASTTPRYACINVLMY